MIDQIVSLAARPKVREIGKYALGCGVCLGVKIVITNLALLKLPIWSAYLAAQLGVLFASYFFHSRITFGSKAKGMAAIRDFGKFALSLSVFMLIDYVITVLLSDFLLRMLARKELLGEYWRNLVVTGCILSCSVLIFALRYVVYSYIFTSKSKAS